MKAGILVVLVFCSVAGYAQARDGHNTHDTIPRLETKGTIYITELCQSRKPYVRSAYVPIYDINTSSYTFKRDELRTMPTTDITDVIALFPTVYQRQRGKDVCIGGAKADGTLYIIDGMQIMR